MRTASVIALKVTPVALQMTRETEQVRRDIYVCVVFVFYIYACVTFFY